MADWNARHDLASAIRRADPDNRVGNPWWVVDALVEWLRENNERVAEDALVSGMGVLDVADLLEEA